MKEQGKVKERIMNTACRLFYEQSYQATGINQIIEEAGIAKSSLYQHFASKEILLNEYLSTTKEEWFRELSSFTASFSAGKEKLLAMLDYRKERLERYNFKGCTFSRVIYELPNLDETSATIIRQHKDGIKAFVYTQLQAVKSPYPEDELNEMTELLFNLMEGAILQTTLYHSVQPYLDVQKTISKLL